MGVEMGRLSWIVWMRPFYSHEFLKVEGRLGYVNEREMWLQEKEQRAVTLLALKLATSWWMGAASRWKRQGKESRPPPQNIQKGLSPVCWTHHLQNYKIKKKICAVLSHKIFGKRNLMHPRRQSVELDAYSLWQWPNCFTSHFINLFIICIFCFPFGVQKL